MSEKIVVHVDRSRWASCPHESYSEGIDERDGSTKYVCHDCGLISRNKCEVYSRVVGYLRPTNSWNPGKRSEFDTRKTYSMKEGISDRGETAETD